MVASSGTSSGASSGARVGQYSARVGEVECSKRISSQKGWVANVPFACNVSYFFRNNASKGAQKALRRRDVQRGIANVSNCCAKFTQTRPFRHRIGSERTIGRMRKRHQISPDGCFRLFMYMKLLCNNNVINCISLIM